MDASCRAPLEPPAPSFPPCPTLFTGAILAGGDSRRLGRDKAQATLQARPLALWVADALKPWVAASWLITNQPLAHLSLGLPLLTDLIPWQGPLGGLATALFYARTPWVLATAVDNPLVAAPVLEALIAAARKTSRPAVVCRSHRGLEPFPGLYATRLFSRLMEFLAHDRRPRLFLEQCQPAILDEALVYRLDPEGHTFFNLNTPQDLAQARQALANSSE